MATFSKKKVYGKVEEGQLMFIPMTFQVVDENKQVIEDAQVVHAVRFPRKEAREQHERDLVAVKGRKPKLQRMAADFSLWKDCIDHVRGYEDDGIYWGQNGDYPKASLPELVKYFDDDIGVIHVQACIERLNEHIGAGDSEFEKKLDHFSEVSSPTTKTSPKTHTSVTP